MSLTVLSRLTKTNAGRSFSHFAIAFVGALLPQLVWTSSATLKASVIAAFPAVLAVAYRELWANVPPSYVTPLPPAPAPPPVAPEASVQPTPTPVIPLEPPVVEPPPPTPPTV